MRRFPCQGSGIPATAFSSYFNLVNVKNLLILAALTVSFQRRCHKAVGCGAGSAEHSCLLSAGLALELARCWCPLTSLLKQFHLSILVCITSLLDTLLC